MTDPRLVQRAKAWFLANPPSNTPRWESLAAFAEERERAVLERAMKAVSDALSERWHSQARYDFIKETIMPLLPSEPSPEEPDGN